MARTVQPMISATDPFISGQMALVNPNDILNTVENCYSYYDDFPLKGKSSEIGFDDFNITEEGLDDIIKSVNNNHETHVIDFDQFQEFVESIEADHSEYLFPDQTTNSFKPMKVVLPDSPVSMEDDIFSLSDYQSLESFEIFSDGTESLLDENLPNVSNEIYIASNDSTSLSTDETILNVDNNLKTISDGTESLLNGSFTSVDDSSVMGLPTETLEDVNDCSTSNIRKSRSGRVNKRKSYDDDDDEDYEPVKKQNKKRCSTKKISKPRVRIYDEETKRQNMIAARRYREKKRFQQESLDDIYDDELKKNTKLKKDVEQFQSEISILKDLLSSVLKPHSIVRIVEI